jgi:hypothetical protein
MFLFISLSFYSLWFYDEAPVHAGLPACGGMPGENAFFFMCID